jgi:hypothetical protein
MIVGVFATISSSVNRQRYNDVVYSTIDYLKAQYNYAANTHNNRPLNTTCNKVTGIVSEGEDSARGTSDCYIVGRIIRSTDGATLTSRPLLARNDTTAPSVTSALNEKALLVAMQLSEDSITDDDTYRLGYDTYLSERGGSDRAQFSMIIVRLPTNNLLRTLIVKGGSAGTSNIANIVNNSASTVLCVEPNGLIFWGKNGMSISGAVSGATAVEFATTEGCA